MGSGGVRTAARQALPDACLEVIGPNGTLIGRAFTAEATIWDRHNAAAFGEDSATTPEASPNAYWIIRIDDAAGIPLIHPARSAPKRMRLSRIMVRMRRLSRQWPS
jgi:hypothetical protein